MPGTKKSEKEGKKSEKKSLYIAKSLSELNGLAELPAKMKTNNTKLLVKTADKMLKEAEHSDLMNDDERAYVLFMKYFNVVSYLKKTADYKKQKVYYDDLLGQKNLLLAINKAEELSGTLKNRYDEVEAEVVAEKLASLEKMEKKSEETAEKGDSKSKEEEKTEPEKEKGDEGKVEKKGSITCLQLFTLMEDKDTQLIIMDVRSVDDFQESRINHKDCINIPEDALPPGTTVTYIEKALPMDSLSLWKQRGNIDHIVLLDWHTTSEQMKIGTHLQTLKDALYKYDSTVIIKSEPLVLEGGYEQWLLHYPTRCINPSFQHLSRPSSTSQDSLMDFDYPDFDQAFLMTPTPTRPTNQKTDRESSSQSNSVVNGDMNGPLTMGGLKPQIDRTTKPRGGGGGGGGGSSITVTEQTTLKASGSKSLYPDVGALTSVLTNQPRVHAPRNTDSRAPVKSDSSDSTAATQIRSAASGSLASVSSDIERELAELDRQKKLKLEELERMQKERERIRLEERARLEKMKQEEKKLSDLEELRRKQQSDVADLMRLKRNLQDDIKQESRKIELDTELKDREEKDRLAEIAVIQRVEEEKKLRQEEVSRLRQERKMKEEGKKIREEKAEREKEAQELALQKAQEQALRDAKERARQEEEQRQRDLKEAENRAIKLREEQDAQRAKQEDARKQTEERIKAEKEKQAQLERERQAALEEERRKRAEEDRLESERREKVRQEKERQERERVERERKEREEADRLRALEAKRAADEKLKLMNEANMKARAVPSMNLQSGWEKQLDPKTRRYFYINHDKGTTQWEEPLTPTSKAGATYTTKLQEEPRESRRGLQRSNSSPNIAQLVENEAQSPVTPFPSVNRSSKPALRPKQQTMQKPTPMPVKRRDFNPVYGNVGRALTGLRNLGNTCYMNSTIQCLNNTSPLVTYLLTEDYLWDINRESILGSHGEVADEFAHIVKVLWSGQYRFVTPRDFKLTVGKHQPMFSGYDQQDSQEFLTFLLDGLHEGLNKVKKRPVIPEQDNDKLPDHSAAELAWKHHKLLNESIIVELFQGQLKSTLMCLTCKKQSRTFQAFMYLSLPIPSSSRCTLQDCVRQFLHEEKMTGSSRWRCPRCKVDRDSVKKIDIWKLPRILLIALNRFVYDGQWRDKINTYVDFPARGMDLGDFVQGPSTQHYKLYGISNHFGSLDGGHYTAYCKNAITQKWYKFDDHEVYDMSESSIKTSAAYVLYYTSIELLPPEFRPSF